jgi:hypothetical protein
MKKQMQCPIRPTPPSRPSNITYIASLPRHLCKKISDSFKSVNGNGIMFRDAYPNFSHMYLVEPEDGEDFINATKQYKKDMAKYEKVMAIYNIDAKKWNIKQTEINLKIMKKELQNEQKNYKK